jgi:two-component system catabolic regulation response regulator CreB
MATTKLLLVEDEGSIAEPLLHMLRIEGFECEWVQSGGGVVEALARFDPALVILDIGLPDESGFDVCRRLRARGDLPILFLTARNHEADRVLGLELGGDDYVTKPYSSREVAARVKAILRRTRAKGERGGRAAAIPSRFEHDPERCRISYKSTPLLLSRYEYRLLALLLSNPGRVFTRERLMDLVWESPEMSLERTVDTHIKTVRAKLREVDPEADEITTHRGIGYSLKED